MNLAAVHDLLVRLRGIDPSTLSQVAVRGAVQRRMAAQGFDTAEAYAERLAVDADEFEVLIQGVLVHETSFFRYPASFDLLAQEATRRVSEGAGVFRVHCVASSTGEEPASVVMALLGAGVLPGRFHVDATDISERAVAYAREGRYRARGVERLPPALQTRWFQADGAYYLLHADVRRAIHHRVVNALDPDFGVGVAPYDAILCRNLLIYLVPAARRHVLETLLCMLRPGGLLLVGHAEMAAARAMGLELVQPAEAFACRRPRALASVAARPAPVAVRAPRPRAAPTPPPAMTTPLPAPRPAPRAASGADGLLEATRLADAGRLPEARRALLDGIAGGPVTADHYHLLALVESAQGHDPASEDALRRALYLDPHHQPSLMQLALLVEARGERGRAERLRAKAARAKGGRDDD